MKVELSIIIVNWNTREVTCNCLESIYKSNTKLTYEVIVVDNASSDDSVEAIKANFPQVRLIESDINGGFAWANNKGMDVAQGQYFLLLNSDTIILGNVLDTTYEFILNHSEAGVLGCRVLNKDMTLQPTCFMYPSLLNLLISLFWFNKLFWKNRFFGREQMTWWNREDERVVQAVTGCFMLVKKELVKEIGTMDDSFFMYAEETDWCYRFERAGYKNYYTPAGEIIHLGGVSTSRVKPQMILQLKSGILHFLKKNRNYIHYGISCLLVSLWFLFRCPFWLFASLTKKDEQSMIYLKTYLKGTVKSLKGYKGLSIK